jgi:hypothetical protein
MSPLYFLQVPGTIDDSVEDAAVFFDLFRQIFLETIGLNCHFGTPFLQVRAPVRLN